MAIDNDTAQDATVVEASGRDRLLLRLWLAMPNCRALPVGQEVLWGNIEAGQRRGGIGQMPA